MTKFPLQSLLKFFLLAFVLLLASCSGNRKLFSGIEKDLRSSAVYKQGFTGMAVYDPQEKKLIFEHNSAKYFIPASNIKLYTFYTGLKILGDSVPALRYTARNDSLMFQGTGDPSLLNPHLPSSKVLSFLKNSKANLFYLPPSTEESYFGPGWAWDDYNDYYSVERSSLPVYGNEVTFRVPSIKEIPETYPSAFRDSLVPDTLLQKRIRRELTRNQFRYPPDFSKTNTEQTIPFKTSTETAIELLKDTLHRQIKIFRPDNNVVLENTFYSISTDSLYKRMLQESDNFVAEQVLMLAANELADTLKTGIAIKHMKKNYLKDLPDETKWVDGSGLSRYNLTTPGNMVSLLEKIWNEVPYKKLFHLLPTGGETGTLQTQFKGEEPFIFAKTGSLRNNYSLSGYLVTKKGRILIFSFMNSNYIVPSSVLKQEMEKILRAIRNNY